MKKQFTKLSVSLLLLCSLPVFAQQQWCTGQVVNYIVYVNGDVMINPSFNSNWIRLCNLSTPGPNDPSTKVCSSWWSAVMIAKQAQSNIIVQYANTPACNTIPPYNDSPVPVYVGSYK